jgi:hypothetical protein
MISALILLLYYTWAISPSSMRRPCRCCFLPLFFIWIARLWLPSFRMEIQEDPLLHVSTDPFSLIIIGLCIGLGALAAMA